MLDYAAVEQLLRWRNGVIASPEFMDKLSVMSYGAGKITRQKAT